MRILLKNKKLILALMTAIMAFCAIIAGVALNNVKNAQADMYIDGATVSQSYAVGYTFKLGKVSVTVGDKKTTANVAIKKDGETLATSSEKAEFTFEEAGNYQLVYYTYLDGKYYNKVIDFSVSVKPYFDFSNINASYNLGDEIQLDIEAVSGDSRVPAQVTLSGPDGVIPAVKTHTFNMLGDYVLSAKATIGGQEYFDSKIFNVANNEYVDLVYVKEGNAEIEGNVDAPSYRYEANGISIKPVSGAVIGYANVVNMNNVDKTVNLMTFAAFLGDGYTTVNNVTLVLTDKYDAKNKVEIQIFSLSDSSNVFAKVIYGSISTGIGSSGKPSTTRYTTELYNANLQTKFHEGTYSGKRKSYMSVIFEPTEKAFYAVTTKNNAKKVLDLDDPLHVGYGKEWAGWTTGEVYAEIRIVCTDNSKLLFTELFGQSLSGTDIVDNAAPSIITETNETTLPLGFVGKQYKIPVVTAALDVVEGNLSIANVRTQISRVEGGLVIDCTDKMSNGYFVPDVAGEYRVEYYVQDSVGNKSIKLCYFTIEPANVNPVVTCAIPETAIVGSSLQIPEISVTGLSDIVNTSIKYVYNGKELDKKTGDVITFNEGGTFKVVYEFEDYVGNVVSGEKVVQLQIDNKPIIKLSGVPYTAIKGGKLMLPDFEAIDYNFSEGQAGRYPTRTIKVNGVAVDSTRIYNVTQNAGERLEVVFSAGTASEVRYIDVIDPVYRSDYFITTADKEDNVDGISFTFSEDTSVKLANPMYVNDETGMEIRWSITETSKFKYFTYQLTDYYDLAKQVKIKVDVQNNLVQINEKGDWLTLSVANGYGLTYNNYSYQLVDVGLISTYLDGMPFAGFSDMVIVEFGFSGVESISSVNVSTIGRATLAGDFNEDSELLPYDDTKAVPIVLKKTPTYKDGILTVYKATAWKIFSGEIPVTVTLKKPNTSAKITAVDGVSATALTKANADKDYQVSISGYGWWTASYEYPKASDGGAAGGGGALQNTAKYNFVDVTPITYKLGGSIATNVNVNGSIKLPTVKILTGGTATCKYVVMEADGHTAIYEAGSSVTLKSVGVCRIILVISGETQEVTAHFEINVKGAK